MGLTVHKDLPDQTSETTVQFRTPESRLEAGASIIPLLELPKWLLWSDLPRTKSDAVEQFTETKMTPLAGRRDSIGGSNLRPEDKFKLYALSEVDWSRMWSRLFSMASNEIT